MTKKNVRENGEQFSDILLTPQFEAHILHVENLTFSCVTFISPWSSYSPDEFHGLARVGLADFTFYSA
jgi:hypothetical protein